MSKYFQNLLKKSYDQLDRAPILEQEDDPFDASINSANILKTDPYSRNERNSRQIQQNNNQNNTNIDPLDIPTLREITNSATKPPKLKIFFYLLSTKEAAYVCVFINIVVSIIEAHQILTYSSKHVYYKEIICSFFSLILASTAFTQF